MNPMLMAILQGLGQQQSPVQQAGGPALGGPFIWGGPGTTPNVTAGAAPGVHDPFWATPAGKEFRARLEGNYVTPLIPPGAPR